MRRSICAVLLGLVLVTPLVAGSGPPVELGFQAILRDATGGPATVDLDFTVHYLDAETGGNEIMAELHPAVAVRGGVFRLALGTGTTFDGGGPGTYTTVEEVLADFTDVWMQFEVNEAGSAAPSGFLSLVAKVKSVAGALTTKDVGGKAEDDLLDVSAEPQTKSGDLTVLGTVSAMAFVGEAVGVTGVDADTLGGLDESAFALVGHGHDAADVTGTVAAALEADSAMRHTRADPPCFDSANRYVDCGNGTVTDTVGGLIWLKDASCDVLGFVHYPNAFQAAAGLGDGTCGLTDHSVPGDWRLPTVEELEAVVMQAVMNGCPAPFIPSVSGAGCCSSGPCAFSDIVATLYWTSTTRAETPPAAWTVGLNTGVRELQFKDVVTRIWPVRDP